MGDIKIMLKVLNEIMAEMAKDDLVFSNEQQFQYELAQRLKK